MIVVAAAVGVALSTIGVAGASASRAASRTPRAVRVSSAGTTHAAVSPGTQLWSKLYNSNTGHAESVAVSPSGKTVFVTGESDSASFEPQYATVAYNAATGAQLWAKRYSDSGVTSDIAHSVAVSPNGNTVFVTGVSVSTTFIGDATVAYNAATGAQLWAKRHSGIQAPANGYDNSLAVSPTGSAVYVTGITGASNASGAGYDTIAYNAATGAQLWAKRYNAREAGGLAVAVSPNGNTVFVTGKAFTDPRGFGYATVAYNAATGAQLWAKSHVGAVGGLPGATAYAVAVSPTGGTAYVTGLSWTGTVFDYATIAYNTATGAQQWIKLYAIPGNSSNAILGPVAETVSPTSGTVVVTGADIAGEWGTVAYSG